MYVSFALAWLVWRSVAFLLSLPSFLSCEAVVFHIFDSLAAVAVDLEAENDP
jgi:hypothetical protein